MPRLTLDISMSLDGFIAGPNQSLEHPLGEGGDRLHDSQAALSSLPGSRFTFGRPRTHAKGN
jgi:hypothetical protein